MSKINQCFAVRQIFLRDQVAFYQSQAAEISTLSSSDQRFYIYADKITWVRTHGLIQNQNANDCKYMFYILQLWNKNRLYYSAQSDYDFLLQSTVFEAALIINNEIKSQITE